MPTKKPLPATEPKTPLTVLDKIRKLDADQAKLNETRRSLLETAKSELLARGQSVVAELKTLGFIYVLIEPPKKSHHKPAPGEGGVRERAMAQAMCAICGFDTAPQHDRRSHRHQVPKAPFSEAELTARKLTRL